jgi:hypothetical protein
MIGLDAVFFIPMAKWVLANPVSVFFALGLLTVVAKATPWVFDDKILTLLKGVLQVVIPGTGVSVKNISEIFGKINGKEPGRPA